MRTVKRSSSYLVRSCCIRRSSMCTTAVERCIWQMGNLTKVRTERTNTKDNARSPARGFDVALTQWPSMSPSLRAEVENSLHSLGKRCHHAFSPNRALERGQHTYHFPTFPPPVSALGFGFNLGFDSCAVSVGALCPISAKSSRDIPSGFACFFLRPTRDDAWVVEVEGPAAGTIVPDVDASCDRMLRTSAADAPAMSRSWYGFEFEERAERGSTRLLVRVTAINCCICHRLLRLNLLPSSENPSTSRRRQVDRHADDISLTRYKFLFSKVRLHDGRSECHRKPCLLFF